MGAAEGEWDYPPANRNAVRTAAETDLPALAEALGGTITAARGEHDGPHLTLPDGDRPPVGWEDLDLPGIDVPLLETR